MIFPIGSGGLATTGYSLAALRAANFLGNSISGHSRCFQIIRPGAQGEEIKIRLQIIGGPWRQELESETLSRKLFLYLSGHSVPNSAHAKSPGLHPGPPSEPEQSGS